MHGAIGEDRVDAAGVKAISLLPVRAVDGTGSRPRGPVGGRALEQDQGPPDPDAARVVDPWNRPARTPQFRPARSFGNQDRLRSAVGNVGQARQVVRGHVARRQNALVFSGPVH